MVVAVSLLGSDQHHRILPPDLVVSQTPVVHKLVFVIVTDPAKGALFGRSDYEGVLRRTAIALERETLNRIQLRYSIVEVPVASVGDSSLSYGARPFLQWYEDLRDASGAEGYDMLAFGPDRPVPWCTDAHSLGVVIAGTTFTCLEAPAPTALASNLLIHKIFHGYGFFHQHLRNKQYRLLDWELGLPSFTQLSDVAIADDATRKEIESIAFFSPMGLAAIARGLGCATPADRPDECHDVAGPFSRDADYDGVRDDRDGYPASPPIAGPDADHDGIPDALDLCPGTEVSVSGNVEGGPMTFWSKASLVDLSVMATGSPLEVRWTPASIDVSKRLGDLMYFDESREIIGNHLTLSPATPVRVRVTYDYQGQRVRRSFYVYGESSQTSPGPWAYFNEKEWLYFGRFGCDLPASLDLYDTPTYDRDGDGLPDRLVIPATYDWDGDGVPDRSDTLPTVAGDCADAHVRGVKDTDGDGFCDSYFGEIPTGMGNDPDFDRCPYLAGPDHGCPVRPDGKPWYADAYPFEPASVTLDR